MKNPSTKNTASQIEELFALEEQLADAAVEYGSDLEPKARAALRAAARRYSDHVRAIEGS